MNEDLCCDAIGAAVRQGNMVQDGDEFQAVAEDGSVTLYDIRHCPFCGEGLDDLGFANSGFRLIETDGGARRRRFRHH